MAIREIARAKINLTLVVRGRRPDGYHELSSLVTFAELGDTLDFEPGAPERIAATGPFAAEIVGENLLATTLATLRAKAPALTLGAVHLEKNLPVAAGVGGGSADAGGLLRAVRRANEKQAQAVDWHGIAARLGADIPVCLANVPAVMSGKGERLLPVQRLPSAAAVLVNPRRPLQTAQVFAALAAPPLPAAPSHEPPPAIADLDGLCAYMRAHGNTLQRPATGILPAIGEVISALEAQAGCRLAAMSGSGPTCFGLFADSAAAAEAARALSAGQPSWWIAATSLAGAG
jgi:4-diphosphocytidyl-2-C-methyl-D-erythritol kinase